MVLEVFRGHIQANILGRIATIPREMFFPPSYKMDFAVLKKGIQYWESPHDNEQLTKEDEKEIIDEIRTDFAKGGHVL